MKFRLKRAARLLVHRGVVADRRVRTTAGLDARDAFRRERAVLDQKLRVFGAVNVVGHDGHRVALAQPLAELETEHGFARTDRTTNTNTRRTSHGRNAVKREAAKKREGNA